MSAAVVVSASYDKQIRLWDAASGRTVKSFAFQESQINSLYLLPDTGYLAVAGFGVLRLYNLAAYMHNGGPAAAGGNAAGAAAASNQAPPIYSSFESQSSMNFTSLSAVPLLPTPNDGQSSTLSNSSRQLTDSASSVLNDQLLGTVVISELGGLLGHGFKEVASLLIATSEDGHIRFFDANSPNALRILKDIATGAAITCCAVSPDRKYLLTGNQMGQVSMWHLPSIVASVAMEMKQSSLNKANAHRNNNNNSSPPPPPPQTTEAAETDPATVAAAEAEKQAEKENMEVLKAFGRYALQELTFANDYSAIRSIAIEPLGRWAAIATNAGKVHFLRLARDKSVYGSKAGLASGVAGTASQLRANAAAAAANSTGQLTPREVPRIASAGGTPQLSPQKSHGNSVMDSMAGGASSRLALTGKAGSYSEGGLSGGGGGGGGPSSYHGPRESIYRSALVVSELSANARRASGVSEEGAAGGEVNLSANRVSGTTIHNSIGAVLLDHLEQHQNSLNSRSNQTTPRLALVTAGLAAPVEQLSAAARLAEDLEMEVFDTIQAHYKYILRVLISPNAELLTTCSADYSVGRFVVPAALRLNPSPSASLNTTDKTTRSKSGAADASDAAAAAGSRKASTQRGSTGGAAAAAAAGEEEEELHTDTFSPSFASTQGPLRSTPGEQPVNASQQPTSDAEDAAAVAAKNASTKRVRVATVDSNSANSLMQSFDGTTARAPEEAVAAAAAGASTQPPLDFKPLKPLTGHHRWVWDGVFSDCSNFLFTASSDNTVRMWNGLTTDRPQSVGFVGHTKPVVAVLLCYDRRRVNAGSPSS